MLKDKPKNRLLLALDADKTLAAFDSGEIFWRKFFCEPSREFPREPLEALFSGPMQYSYKAFRQAALHYESTKPFRGPGWTGPARWKDLYPQMQAFLSAVIKLKGIDIFIITCGMGRVWKQVIASAGLSEDIKVVGGSWIEDDFVVSPQVKGDLIEYLRDHHGKYVYAFGDSPLDLEMLEQADVAHVVVGDTKIRSKSTEAKLAALMEKGSFKATQILLPDDVPPRLSTDVLPVTNLVEIHTRLKEHLFSFRITHLTDSGAAKILMTETRDKKIFGPNLRRAHEEVGRYLALNSLPNVIGLEEVLIDHVAGATTAGFKIKDEETTTIIALMRGGEPLAYGVSEMMHHAMFVHASDATDVKKHHVTGQSTILLVDSVINSGTSVLEFIRHIRSLSGDIQICVVAGVVQEDSIKSKGMLGMEMLEDENIKLVALRISANKYKGTGGTDTGNRLFNTQHLA